MNAIPKLALALLTVSGCGSSQEATRPVQDASGVATPGSGNAQVTPTDASTPADGAAGPADTTTAKAELAHAVYVGGWASGDYPYRSYAVDRTTLALTQVGAEVNLGVNPSFAVGSRDGRHLYVANESWAGQPALTVAAIDERGALTHLQEQALPGSGSPVFTTLTPSGDFLLAADISRGQVFVLKLESGRIGAITDTKTIAAPAAKSAETHSVLVHPSGKWVYAPNKAIDQIAQFALADDGTLTPLSPATVAGADEPRMIAIHPNGAVAYVMHEKSSVIVTYRIGKDGALARIAGETSTLPTGFSGTSTGAHVAVHASGRFLYASNRGHDSIAAFAIADDGALSLLGHTPSGGKTPRHFDLDPRGELLVVANQGTSESARDGTLVAFAIGSDGRLSAPGPAVTGLVQPTSATIVSRARPN